MLGEDPNQDGEEEVTSMGNDQFTQESTFHLVFIENYWRLHWAKRNKLVDLPMVDPHLLMYLASRYMQKFGDTYVPKYQGLRFYSEEKNADNVLFRAHPSYRSGRAWNDWVSLNWVGKNNAISDDTPAKVLMFVLYLKDETNITQNNAIIWSATTVSQEYSVLTKKFTMTIEKKGHLKGKPKFECVSPIHLKTPCFCYPNFGSDDPNEYLLVLPKSDWADKFNEE
jgi:hypothetical protein